MTSKQQIKREKSNSLISGPTLLVASVALMCLMSCQTTPGWARAVQGLSPAEVAGFQDRLRESTGGPVRLTGDEAELLLARLGGPVLRDFRSSDLQEVVWLVDEGGLLTFYRLRKNQQGYSMVAFTTQGGFIMSGGGHDNPW